MKKIPFEGLLSNASLLISDSLSVYYSMLSSYSFLAISWCITTFIWVFSSLYALYEAPEELVQLE
ncbi:hypothetical protein B9Q11_00565 [Candidatus Marsarchaeota G2 archaeon ECH_B_SAG-F08]|uniref:Uncharacterized protein n=2 Tax=Candidatus Marsarchaeota group 2 TaxID=2203771 RepID=A0A2R6BMC6_9ARCH|nr:MAG: hypothetical protein B9Q11_00565 [Candidatus Marsarchaeota G2 archaeon ECH_B_SAG-F08]PSO04351.1 MAG: hypothetical protein B9Q13_04800 [Candidatus Marsarchaeota G2 archaeon ECH_B_SAG-G16]